MRFAHIADTHIRNLKYHFEYKEVFKQLYKSLKEENSNLIQNLNQANELGIDFMCYNTVSYTHLTLPTICSV